MAPNDYFEIQQMQAQQQQGLSGLLGGAGVASQQAYEQARMQAMSQKIGVNPLQRYMEEVERTRRASAAKPKTIKEELQSDTDEWLKDIKI